jgi:hypothetical protein
MRPERTLPYKLMLNVIRGALVAGALLARGVFFILVSVSMKDPNRRGVTMIEAETMVDVYVRNRTHSPLLITMRMPQNLLSRWQERFQQVNPSHYQTVAIWPVTGQPDSADVEQTVAPDSCTLLTRQTKTRYRGPDGTETTENFDDGTYEVMAGPYPFTPRPVVRWVDGQHRVHTHSIDPAAIGRSLVTDSGGGSARKSKTVQYLDYR